MYTSSINNNSEINVTAEKQDDENNKSQNNNDENINNTNESNNDKLICIAPCKSRIRKGRAALCIWNSDVELFPVGVIDLRPRSR